MITIIHYIGFFVYFKDKYKRTGSVAATNKMCYISSSIASNNTDVEIISPSWFVDKLTRISGQQKVKLYDKVTLIQAPSFSTPYKLINFMRIYISKIWLFFYILKNISNGENIIVYHSLGIMNIVNVARRIIKFKLVLEVNEIYTDVHEYTPKKKKKERKFLASADKYIFCTELLNDKINQSNKPYIINYGTYKIEKSIKEKFEDDKIHIVYAGTFDSVKGGVFTAIKVAEHLEEKYHIHILGFGNDNEIEQVKTMISNVSEKAVCKITYDGMLNGEEYIRFVQKCDIGLSTQTPGGAFNETSFPSKVLSYLANGLRVVSIRLKVLEESMVNELLYYYNNNTPSEIADVIKGIDFKLDYNSKGKIEKIDKTFKKEIRKLLEL